jgi:hypothetical protein
MAVAAVLPYLKHLAGKVMSKAEEDVAAGAIPAVKRLYERVKERFADEPYAAAQLSGVAERPDSESRTVALRAALEEVLASDAEFAADVRRLVEEARANGAVVVAQDAGVVAGGDVTMHGKYVAGRDMNIGGHQKG